jgi:hypothetical protein
MQPAIDKSACLRIFAGERKRSKEQSTCHCGLVRKMKLERARKYSPTALPLFSLIAVVWGVKLCQKTCLGDDPFWIV